MMTLLRALVCAVFGHRPRVTVRGPSQALVLHTHLIDGKCVEREVQGFIRTITCPRCKVAEYQIVFEEDGVVVGTAPGNRDSVLEGVRRVN